MNMEQVEQVITVASLASINKAAKKLFISQPNLSLSIKNLEKELNRELFKRTSRGVELTDYGREFLSFAKPTYSQFEFLKSFCSTIHDQDILTFHMSSQYFKFASSLFIQIYKKYQDREVNFYFHEESIMDIIESVHTQTSELGILILSNSQKDRLQKILKYKNLEYFKLSDEIASAIFSDNNPLFYENIQEVTLDMLKPYPLIVYSDENYNFSLEWKNLGFAAPTNMIEVKDRSSMYEFITETSAYTIGIHNNYAYQNTNYYSKIKPVPIADRKLTFELGWVKHKGHPLSPIGTEYMEALQKAVTTCVL